jgi:hypothetical protein
MGLKLGAIGNTHWGTTWEHIRTPHKNEKSFPHNPHPSKRMKKKVGGLECMLHFPIAFVQVLFSKLVVTIFDLG